MGEDLEWGFDLIVSLTAPRIDALSLREQIAELKDWSTFIERARVHHLTPMIYHNLRTSKALRWLPSGIEESLRCDYAATLAKSMILRNVLYRVVQILGEWGKPFLLWKGPVLDVLCFGGNGFRPFGDIDILVRRDDWFECASLLVTHGFDYKHLDQHEALVWSDEHSGHLVSEESETVELHWRLSSPSFSHNISFDRIWEVRQTYRVDGIVVESMNMEWYIICLSVHAANHSWDRICMIAEIAALIDLGKVNWEAVYSKADSTGCRRCVQITLLLIELIYGLPAEKPVTNRQDWKIAEIIASKVKKQYLGNYSRGSRHFWALLRRCSSREKLRDKAACISWLFRPKKKDICLIELPRNIWSGYYLVRLMRIVFEVCRRGAQACQERVSSAVKK